MCICKSPQEELNVLHFFLHYLFVFDDSLLIYGLFPVNAKKNVSLHILKVVDILPSVFDILVPEMYGPRVMDAKFRDQLGESPWLLKFSCNFHKVRQVEFSQWTLGNYLTEKVTLWLKFLLLSTSTLDSWNTLDEVHDSRTYLYYLFNYDDTHFGIGFVHHRGRGIWVLHFFNRNKPLWVIVPLLVWPSCEAMK